MSNAASIQPPFSVQFLKRGIQQLRHCLRVTPPFAQIKRSAIPETFTKEQTQWVLALHRLHAIDPQRALELLRELSPMRCSVPQAVCIEELLELGPEDLRATLADAMGDCDLRERLQHWH
jgi:hypothetical protein